ncbi:hypothetical protein NKH77_53285 [Streptomyces sp. M19]
MTGREARPRPTEGAPPGSARGRGIAPGRGRPPAQGRPPVGADAPAAPRLGLRAAVRRPRRTGPPAPRCAAAGRSGRARLAPRHRPPVGLALARAVTATGTGPCPTSWPPRREHSAPPARRNPPRDCPRGGWCSAPSARPSSCWPGVRPYGPDETAGPAAPGQRRLGDPRLGLLLPSGHTTTSALVAG